ncbi:MAG: NAD-dependent epimerase/dehydratase family protein [Actinobacteria bacterium]|jgi:UDP-glucose 4-epimerase|nr:MAG: NAD-dependent epimerase/dehydratase family protein [Actinomycetota bacterium]
MEVMALRLFISGISGYLGTVVLRALEEDASVSEIVGVDLRPPAVESCKLEFHAVDVRDAAGIRKAMRGCGAALHMAFVLDEIRDKEKTYDININGSKNVFRACLDTGTPWLIQVSSMAAFGAHPDNPFPMSEDEYPRGDCRCYYSYSKAEIEHYLYRLSQQHPELAVTILRPCVIVGRRLDNTISWVFSRKFALSLRGCDPHTQFLHEDDLASAISLVLHEQAKGIYHVTSDDTISFSEMTERAGMIAPAVPADLMCRIVDLAYRFRLSPFSSHWVNMFRYSMVGSNEKIKRELGWQPSYTSRELFELVLEAGRRPGA